MEKNTPPFTKNNIFKASKKKKKPKQKTLKYLEWFSSTTEGSTYSLK